MPKARVYDIAKEQNITSKELVDLLKNNDIEVKSHSSSVDEDEAIRIIGRYKEGKTTGNRQPNTDNTNQTMQNKSAAEKNAPRINIWREDNQQERIQKENLQKEVIRQKQMQQPQRNSQPIKGQQNVDTASGKENEGNQKKPDHMGANRQQPRQMSNTQQQASGTQQQRPQQTGSAQRQRPQQESGAQQQRQPQNSSGTQQQRQPQNSSGTQQQRQPQQASGTQRQRAQQEQGAQRQRPPQQASGTQQQRSPQQASGAQQQRQPQQASGTQQQRPRQTTGASQASGTQQQRPQQASGTQQQRPQQASGAQQQRPRQASGTQQGSGAQQQRPPQQAPGTQQQRPRQTTGTQQQRSYQSSGASQQRGQQQRSPQSSGSSYSQQASRSSQTQRTDSSARSNSSNRVDSSRNDLNRSDSNRSDSNRNDNVNRKDSGAQRQALAQKPHSNQKSAYGQKSTYNQKGQAGQRSHSVMPSIEKPSAPKKHSSKKLRAQKAAEAEQAAAAAEALINEQEQAIGIVYLPKMISVKDLAVKLDKEATEVIKALMKRGIMANLNQEVDFYNAALVAEDFERLVEKEEEIDLLEEAFAEEEDNEDDKTERSPVVVVMGHVDHGKTSLLDRIRKANVTVSEAGGITQHIGAYTVTLNGKMLTFLDTPGHEAFTAMRMRGAQVTDIAVLVVAADDGVMPQTIEAINHAKAANVEIIVAINKIDRPSANPDRVKQELAEHGLLSESWGGDTICVEVSAMTGDGIDSLLEMITVVAEMKELKANANKRARGTVIEALLDKGRGPVATVLVQSGTLSVGDPVVAGATHGKIRAMSDDKGKKLKTAGPSMPVEILGLSEVPLAGDMFYVANNEKHARVLAESVIAKGREDMVKSMPKISLDHLFDQIQLGNVKDLNLVVKADVQGSVEAVKNSLERLSNDEVRIKTIHGGVGAVTESDVMLASASNAIIIGFNVRPEASAKAVADTENVDIRLYRIIYNAIEDITAAMKGLLDPVFKEKVIGHAEIRQLFKASGVGTIGGSYIQDGKFIRNAKVRIIRNSKVIYDGTLDTLKRFKDDVKEVNSGYECGLLFNRFNDIKEGDIVEAYIMEEIPR